jgi:hypothetical protein
MPLKVKVDGKWLWLQFDNPYGLNQISLDGQEHTIEFDPNFYVYTQNVMGN